MTWHPWHETFFVYVLLHPYTDRVVYVGITVNPKQRHRVHMIVAAQAYRGNTPLKRFLLWCRMEKVKPPMLLMEKALGVMEARRREAYYIDLYTKMGEHLLNTANMPVQERLI